MTLIAAFRASTLFNTGDKYDAVVLCADQQETIGDLRVAVNKLRPQECGQYYLAIAGSGNGDLIDGFAYALKLAMDGWPVGLDQQAVYAKIDTLLQDYYANQVYFYPSNSADDKMNEFLVCIKPKQSEDIFLWTLRGTAIAPIDDYVLMGVGTAIYNHELKKLSQPGARYSLHRTLLLALHLFSLAKATSNYVGGNTDAVVVDSGGMTVLPEADVQSFEWRLGLVNERIAELILACPDMSMNDEALKQLLAKFELQITSLRKWIRDYKL